MKNGKKRENNAHSYIEGDPMSNDLTHRETWAFQKELTTKVLCHLYDGGGGG